MNIKKGDTVAVITGKDKGKDGKVLTVTPKNGKVIVEGVNIQKRHTKPRSAQQTGGILEKAGAIDASNVMVLCPKCKKATRVAHAYDESGKKYRACKKCGENLDKSVKVEKPAKKETAKKETAKPAKKSTAKKAKDTTAEKTE